MNTVPEGSALIYCEQGFRTLNGKTAHGLVRFTNRYRVLAVIDSTYAGQDAGEVLDGRPSAIPIYASLEHAYTEAQHQGSRPTHFVIGLAPDGGRLSEEVRVAIREALLYGLNVDSGLHDYISEDSELRDLAMKMKVTLRDIRKPPSLKELHFFSGNIEKVSALKIAVLGTDSAVGKRTTAWKIVHSFQQRGHRAELIGTGQTAWMQGAEYCIILDSLINDFVSGEIEHVIYSAWQEKQPEVIVIEGQGSLMNPAYPGGFEILAAGRPDLVVLQHAPARKDYDGFPGYPIQPLRQYVQVISLLSGKPVVAITVNHEDLNARDIHQVCQEIERDLGIPCYDVLEEGAEKLIDTLISSSAQLAPQRLHEPTL